MKLQTILEKYRATGRVAFVYPRLKKIALSGGKLLEIPEATERMLEVI